MEPVHLFELLIAAVIAIIGLHYLAQRLKLPPSASLLVGGAALAFVPGLPTATVDPELVLVLFLPPLLQDSAWSIDVARLRRQAMGITSLAVGTVVFTCAAVAIIAHVLFPSLPWSACVALGAIVSPPDAISSRAILQRVRLPRRLHMLIEGESLFNDASSLVLFRLAIAASATGAFSLSYGVADFFKVAVGGCLAGFLAGYLWRTITPKLGHEYLVVVCTALLSWVAYISAEMLHTSGVIATVTAAIVASRYQYTVLSASTRLRTSSFLAVLVFLLEAAVFVLIGLSLRGVIERAGGLEVVANDMGPPIAIILLTLLLSRITWVFGSEAIIHVATRIGFKRWKPLGLRAASVLSWAGVRGVVTLALALSLPSDFPGRDFILVASFAAIFGTVVLQATTLERLVSLIKLSEEPSEGPSLTLRQAEAVVAHAQLEQMEILARDENGTIIHPQLLDQFTQRAAALGRLAERTEQLRPLVHAHFDLVLAVVAAGRRELSRLHTAGEIDDETLHELSRDLDLEELSALANKI